MLSGRLSAKISISCINQFLLLDRLFSTSMSEYLTTFCKVCEYGDVHVIYRRFKFPRLRTMTRHNVKKIHDRISAMKANYCHVLSDDGISDFCIFKFTRIVSHFAERSPLFLT